MATKSGVSKMTVQRVEAGAIHPRGDTLLAMAHVLGREPPFVPSWLLPKGVSGIHLGQTVRSAAWPRCDYTSSRRIAENREALEKFGSKYDCAEYHATDKSKRAQNVDDFVATLRRLYVAE